MRSRDNGTALTAIERARANRWHLGNLFKGINLSNAALEGANLSKTNLEGANLLNANLSHSNLSSINLKNARLWNVNLEGANLSDADLEGAELRSANLQGVRLTGANLKGTTLNFAKLEGVYLGKDDNYKKLMFTAPFRYTLKVTFNENTRLPTGQLWQPDTDMSMFGCFTDFDECNKWRKLKGFKPYNL